MLIFYERRFGVLEDLHCSSADERRKVFPEDFKRVEYGGTSHDLEV